MMPQLILYLVDFCFLLQFLKTIAQLIYFANLSITVIVMNDLFPGQPRTKITSLFNSQSRFSRSGSITTATLDKQDGIRQSRILNLPNYKKQTLGCRLDFVVVFQTIEIQRLSLEIECLRVRLADSQRQIFNYKSYEVQIRELTERCFEYQSQKSKYEEQITNLKLSLLNLQTAQSEMKNKRNILEDHLRQKEDQLFTFKQQLIIERKQREQSEDHRLQLQSCIKQQQKLYSKQVREIERSTKIKRNQISKNEQHLQKLLKKYHQEVTALQKENASLRNLYDQLQAQSRDIEHRYDELRQQFYRNNQALKEKDFQLQSIEQEYRQKIDILQQRYEQECNLKQRKLEDYDQQLNEWKAKVDKMQDQAQRYEIKMIELSQQCQKYETLLNQAGDEIDRLNTIIKDKIKYLQAWQTRFKQLQQAHSASEQKIALFDKKKAADQEQITKMSQHLKHKDQQLQKLERMREQEIKAIKQKLHESQNQRQELISMRKEKDHDRQDFKRLKAENAQIKQQLSCRITETNKIIQELNKAENGLKELKMNFSFNEAQLKIKDQQLKHCQNQLNFVESRMDKVQRQKRSLEQQAVKVKALEQRVNHEEKKKNEYLNQGKKLTRRLKQTEKEKQQMGTKKTQLEEDINKYQIYSEQLLQKIKMLEEKQQLMRQLVEEINTLKNWQGNANKSIKELKQIIQIKSRDVQTCKNRLAQFQKAFQQFSHRQESFKKQVQIYQKAGQELKTIKIKYDQLQDQHEQLQISIYSMTGAKQELQKQNRSLERIIAINSQQSKRIQLQLQETRQDISARKQSQKQLFVKIKEADRRLQLAELHAEKQRSRLVKQKQESEKQFEKKMKEFEDQFKVYRSDRERALLQRQKQIQQIQVHVEALSSQNQSIKTILQRYSQQKDEINKASKQLEKRVAAYKHDLERTVESKGQTQKQLEISLNQIQVMNRKLGQAQDQAKEQNMRTQELLTQNHNLLAEAKDFKLTLDGKQKYIAHLLQDNRRLKQQITSLQSQLSETQQNESGLIDQLIKLRFRSQNITQGYNTLNKRLSSYQTLAAQLKQNLGETIRKADQLSKQNDIRQKKSQQLQQRLVSKIETFEQLQFEAKEEIIRLETVISLLQIELGEFKDRETAVFSIVREGSLLKEKKVQQLDLRSQGELNQVGTPSNITTTASHVLQKSVRDQYILQKSNMFLQNYGSHETLPKETSKLPKESRMLKEQEGKKQDNMLRENGRGSHQHRQQNLLKQSIIQQINGMQLKNHEEERQQQPLSEQLQEKTKTASENPLLKSRRIYFQNMVFNKI